MATPASCIKAIDAALEGIDRTEQGLDDLKLHIVASVQARKAYLRTERGLSEVAAALQAADEIGNRMKEQSLIAKRNEVLNLTRRTEIVQWVQKNFGSNFARGFDSMIAGIQSAKPGTRLGAAQEQAMLRERYMAQFGHDLDVAGVKDLFLSGSMEKDVWKALDALGRPDEKTIRAGLPPEAVKIANVIDKWQELARKEANEAGAWIAQADSYVVRRTHNSERIEKMGEAAYMKLGRETFDLPKMLAARDMQPAETDAMLRGLFQDFAADHHAQKTSPLVGDVGTHNVGKQLSQTRTIYFKDGEGSWRYNVEAGGPNSALKGGGMWGGDFGNRQAVADAVVSHLSQMAEATGLMRVLGPNPEAVLKAAKEDIIIANKAVPGQSANIRDLQAAQGYHDNLLAAIDGRSNTVGNYSMARWGQNLRSWAKLSKLGMMLFSQLNDIAVHGSGTQYQGRGFFTGMHDMIASLMTNLNDPERRKLAAALGVMMDNWTGELARAGSFEVPGMMSKGVQLFMKYNGANYWNRAGRWAAASGMSAHLASEAGTAFSELHPSFQRVLGQYNIAEKDWNAIRAATPAELYGTKYITPEGIKDAAVADKLRRYLSDQTAFMQLEPDAKTRAIMLQGTNPGTASGELMRAMMLFKTYTASFMQKTLGRELYGRGFEYAGNPGADMIGALRNGQGERGALVNLVLMTTLFGYASMSLKDLAKGKTIRDPTLSKGDAVKVFLASMVQGGGAGIYGDFLLGEANRFGGHTLDTAAGPVIGTVSSSIDWALKLRGELEKDGMKPDIGAELVRGVINNTPGANLPYTKFALDYMLTYRIAESLNPGHLERVKRDMRQNNSGQQFLPHATPRTGW